jgi:sigma-B regulation protein RsbU (phosphoserine phosphatase)
LRGVLQSASEFSPSEILEQVNSTVYNDTKVSEVFATLSIIVINNKKNLLKYSGAGDIPIIYKPVVGEIQRIKAKGLLLGFSKQGEYEDAVLQLSKNDRVYLTTDGLIDSRSRTKESFGEHRLFNLINELGENQNPLDIIKGSFDKFTDSEYDDDVSLILIQAN